MLIKWTIHQSLLSWCGNRNWQEPIDRNAGGGREALVLVVICPRNVVFCSTFTTQCTHYKLCAVVTQSMS